ncbi:MAG TPA: VWA-like domain-containing protein [Acidimicrobiia bacterium]
MSRRADPAPVEAARLWAASRFPYLASALFASPVVLVEGIGTVAVDEAWRLYADPEALARWSTEELGAVLVHHASHLLRDHAARARALGVGEEDSRAWVDAADAEINDDLAEIELPLPGNPVLPAHLGCEAGRFAEEYFVPTRGRKGRCDRCGSGSDGLRRDYEVDGGGLDAYTRGLLRCQVASEICKCGKQPGLVPAGLLRWAEAVLGAKVDWRRLLAAELRAAIADVAGLVDYTYRRPSRRASVAGTVILPALRRPVPEVAVVCDTSGSMTDELLSQSLAEVEGVLRATGLRRTVRVLACDAAVHAVRRVSRASQVELAGGGGTDMGVGLAAAGALRPRPSVVVVLTDGHTPWPPAPPRGVHVVVALLDGHAPEPPAWARTVLVDTGG